MSLVPQPLLVRTYYSCKKCKWHVVLTNPSIQPLFVVAVVVDGRLGGGPVTECPKCRSTKIRSRPAKWYERNLPGQEIVYRIQRLRKER